MQIRHPAYPFPHHSLLAAWGLKPPLEAGPLPSSRLAVPMELATSLRAPWWSVKHLDRACRASASAHKADCAAAPLAAALPPPAQVLLGWAAADRDKAVLKYAELLAQRGYASVRSVQPLLTAFSPLALTRRRWALSLLSYLEQQRLWPQRRLVLFAFSNGEGTGWEEAEWQELLHDLLLALRLAVTQLTYWAPPLRSTGGLYVVEQLMLIAESDPR